MKFSDSTSNQSIAGFCDRMWGKCTVLRPMPMPRSGRFQRLLITSGDCSGTRGDGKGPPSRAAPPGNGGGRLAALAAVLARAGALFLLARVSRVHGNLAAALALAGVLARAAGVA